MVCSEKITKRTLFSMAHRVFDPIDFTCAVMLCLKLLLQQTWQDNLGWEDELSEEMKSIFLEWVEGGLSFLTHLKIFLGLW